MTTQAPPKGFRWLTEDRREAEIQRKITDKVWDQALGQGRN
jgi:hypothetical protein